ncbi:MAG: hypothetical protein M0P17_00975 [Methanoculleus sp.]|nr:hypothetical protein [Methanoculleus sp.]
MIELPFRWGDALIVPGTVGRTKEPDIQIAPFDLFQVQVIGAAVGTSSKRKTSKNRRISASPRR